MKTLSYTLLITVAFSAGFSYGADKGKMTCSSKITKSPAGSISSATKSTPSFNPHDKGARIAYHAAKAGLTCTITPGGTGGTFTCAAIPTKDNPVVETSGGYTVRWSQGERGAPRLVTDAPSKPERRYRDK